MAYQKLMTTESPYWLEPNVTKLIADAKNDPQSRDKLAELVYRPTFRRLDKWLGAAGFKELSLEADDLFDVLWVRDLNTAIDCVDFNSRKHFLRTVLLRGEQAANRAAKRIRLDRARFTAEVESESRELNSPGEAVAYAEMFSHVLTALQNLDSPGFEIVNLHFIEGLAIRQIAGELGLKRSTVHRQMQIALDELKRAIPT